ncbi:MAG TPA: hypothetical protein VFA98_15410 [Thermoanaerobaculia bacterium]|jgi:hypothetical protein|nr:hypothetical protein [Thermoanaerobaculia bacterium]
MRLIGFGPIAIPANSYYLLEWTCEEDLEGDVVSFRAPSAILMSFSVANFRLEKKGGQKLHVVQAEFEDHPNGLRMITKGTCVDLSGAVDHLAEGIPDWHVEPGDKVVLEVANVTAQFLTFSASIAVDEGEQVEDGGRWWASITDGKLVRPVLRHERKLPLGTHIGGLWIVQPSFKPDWIPGDEEVD